MSKMADKQDKPNSSQMLSSMLCKSAGITDESGDIETKQCAESNNNKVILDTEPPTIPKRR